MELRAAGERLRRIQRSVLQPVASLPSSPEAWHHEEEAQPWPYEEESFEQDETELEEEAFPASPGSPAGSPDCEVRDLSPLLASQPGAGGEVPDLSMRIGDLREQESLLLQEPPSLLLLQEVPASPPASPDMGPRSPAKVREAYSASPVKPVLSNDELSQRWCEQEFLLRRPVKSHADIAEVEATAKEGLLFLRDIEQAARELGLLRGAVSRAVLPFNTETSVADQAETATFADGAFGIGAQLGGSRWKRMVKQATAVRSLVRVKIADDADLGQAAAALTATVEFFEALEAKSRATGRQTFDILQEL